MVKIKIKRRKFEALAFAVLFATLVFVTVGCASGTAPPEEAWNKTFGGIGSDTASSVQQTADGGYILAGSTLSYGSHIHGNAGWLLKTDSNGSEQWNKTFGSGGGASSVQQTADGGYIIAGSMYSDSTGSGDFCLIKTDSNGNKQWSKTFGGTGGDCRVEPIAHPPPFFFLR